MAFVDNLTDILNVPNETLFIMDQPERQEQVQQLQRADLSTEEDINKIQQFLGQPLDVSSVADGLGHHQALVLQELSVETDVTTQDLSEDKVEDQPSEDIDEIQRFLECSQIEPPPPPAASQVLPSDVASEQPVASATKYKIPKSPEFKKRFQNKEIVKIVRGTDSHKGHDKAETAKKKTPPVAKPAAPSFEQQLHEAELLDMRAKMEKKRKWKNKSSTRDYMITKKYAKIVDPAGGGKATTSLPLPSSDAATVPTEKPGVQR